MTVTEFDRQVDTYVADGFAEAAGLTPHEFRERLETLREPFESAPANEISPVIVLSRGFATADHLVSAIDRSDGKPDTVIDAAALDRYGLREGLDVPDSDAYVLVGVNKERETRNLPPSEALTAIAQADRSPLTIEEGLAVWRQFPDVIAQNDGLSLAGSTRGDKRVPAIWISKRRPKLGWCFFGVPHTWLATASCTVRKEATTGIEPV